MPQTDQTFTRHNTDDSELSRPTSDFTAAVNIALDFGGVRPQRGNVLVPYSLPQAVSNRRLGGFEDGSTGTVISLLYNGGGFHRIIRYDPTGNNGAGSETTILQWSGLNLSATLVAQGAVLDGVLIFLDALGDVRSVNLKRAAAGEYTDAALLADPYMLHVLKQPAFQMLTPSRQNDPTVVGNQIAFKAFQFALRYVYADGGRSTVSAISPVIYPTAGPGTGIDPLNYIYIPLYSLIKVSSLTSIEVLVREGNNASWNIAGRVRPDATGTWPIYFSFIGNTIGEAVTDAEGAKTFESLWPCAALTIAHSRIFVGQTTEGYPRGGDTSFAAVLVNQDQYDVSTAQVPVSTFHELSNYRVGLQYYDQFRRPGGVVSEITVSIPAQPATPNGTTATGYTRKTIAWSVNNNTPSEIPAWAKYFSVCASSNSRCRAFTQRLSVPVAGYYGDEADGTPKVYGLAPGFDAEEKAMWVLVETDQSLSETGAYVFQEGDILRFMDEVGQEWPVLYTRSSRLRFRDSTTVTATFNWVAIGRRASSVPAFSKTLFTQLGRIEIYSPNKITTGGSLMYEQTDLIPITSTIVGGVAQSQYSFTYGTLQGDTFLVRSNYRTGLSPVSPNQPTPGPMESATPLAPLTPTLGAWLDMRRGTPAFVLAPELGQANRKSLIRFSGVKVQGTLLNGLGQWEVLSQYDDLPQEQGAITRLIVADQTQTDGSILLVTQERGTNSLSLGRSQIQTANNAILLAITNQVIGSSNSLRGAYGCTDPNGIASYAGKVFFPCRARAEILRYDRNGLTPLGLTHKTYNRLKVVFARYAAAQISACFDPRRKEYLCTFHATGNLPDLTLVYSDMHEAWSDEITCSPEAGMGVGNELISWLNGQLWRHTPDAPTATFFGVLSPVSITFITSQPGGRMTKVWRRIAINSYGLWLPTRLTNKENQLSRVLPSWLKYAGGIWRAALRRDETSPGQPNPVISLHEGNELQSAALKVTLTAEVGKNDLLTAASLEYYFSSGQGAAS